MNLGTFNNIGELWRKYPNGGNVGDSATVNGSIVYWSEPTRSWGGSVDPSTPSQGDILIEGKGVFTEGIETGTYVEGVSGSKIGGNGNADFRQVNADSLYIKDPDSGTYVSLASLIQSTGAGLRWEDYTRISINPDLYFILYNPETQETHYTTMQKITEYLETALDGTGGQVIDIIRYDDNAVISDENVFSALRTIKEITSRIEALDDKYLSKVNPDTARSMIKFTQGLTVGTYTPGFGGGGGAFKMENGISLLEVDMLEVRMQAIFYEVFIKRAQHVGGELIVSPANMVCSEVEDMGTYYRCYFNDGEGKVPNTFKEGDLARAQVFGLEQSVLSVADVAPITLTYPYDTPFINVVLPTSVNVELSNNSTISMPVTFGAFTPSYNGSSAGTYRAQGTLTLPDGVLNPGNIKVPLAVVVEASIPIVVPVERQQFMDDNSVGLGQNVNKDVGFRKGAVWQMDSYQYNKRLKGKLYIYTHHWFDRQHAKQTLTLESGQQYFFKVKIQTHNVAADGTGGIGLDFTNTNYVNTSVRVKGTTDETEYTGSFTANSDTSVVTLGGFGTSGVDGGIGTAIFSNLVISKDASFNHSIYNDAAHVLAEAKKLFPLNADYGLPEVSVPRTYEFVGQKIYSNENDLVIDGKEFGDTRLENEQTDSGLILQNCYNVTIRNCKFAEIDRAVGLWLINCTNVVVEECEFNNCYRPARVTTSTGNIIFRKNHFLNVLGTLRGRDPNDYRTAALQYVSCSGAGHKILDNSFLNRVGESMADDTINLFYSFGDTNDFIEVKGNWIRNHGQVGASPTGGGILLADWGGANQIATDNLVVDSGNYGMGIGGGQHITMRNNKVFGDTAPVNTLGFSIHNFTDPQDETWTQAEDINMSNNLVNRRHADGEWRDITYDPEMANASVAIQNGTAVTWDPDLDERILPPNILVRF